jgi:hypothetical protein
MQSFNDLPTASLAVYQQECCSAAQDFLHMIEGEGLENRTSGGTNHD